MPTQIANFLSQNFRAPRPADVDRDAYSNALLRNERDRIPQMNRAQDLQIQATEQAIEGYRQTMTASQRKNAAGIAANYASAIANSADPMRAMQSTFANPDFRAAVKALGIPPEQFVFDPRVDTPESAKAQAADFSRMMGGVATRLENTDIPSNVRVAEYYAGLPQDGPGVTRSIFNEANRAPTVREIAGVQTQLGPGASTQPLGSLSTEIDAQRQLAEARASGTATGGAQGAAAAGLPDALADIDKMRRDIRGFVDHPGFSTVYGKSRPGVFVPASQAAGAEARRRTLDAQAFSVTIQKMRGLGALSNAEGQRVTDAFTHATNPSISEEEAATAWNEVLYTLDLAERRAQQKAGQSQQAPTDLSTLTDQQLLDIINGR